jgi:hypothetical protein
MEEGAVVLEGEGDSKQTALSGQEFQELFKGRGLKTGIK